MGTGFGLIHNQSGGLIFYILHGDNISPFEKIMMNSKDLTPQEIKNSVSLCEGAYTLANGSITYTGLNKIKFKQKKFMTIMNEKGQLIKTLPMQEYDDIRIRIKDGKNILKLSKQETDQLKAFNAGGTIQKVRCSICSEPAKLRKLQEKRPCQKCHMKFEELYMCEVAHNYHCFCYSCHMSNQVEQLIKTQKKG